MKQLSALLLSATVLAFTSCKSHQKKILVYASSDIQVDATQKNITVTEGTTHHEKELDFSGSDPVTITVQSPAGKINLEAAEDGLYIANLKPDTVLGSFQHIGTEGRDNKITQDALKQKLDSLQKMLLDQNVSEANKNYFIAPGKIAKITTELNAKIYGPYTSIPSGFDASAVPELYKFYSSKEIHEIVAKLEAMTGGKNDVAPAADKK